VATALKAASLLLLLLLLASFNVASYSALLFSSLTITLSLSLSALKAKGKKITKRKSKPGTY